MKATITRIGVRALSLGVVAMFALSSTAFAQEAATSAGDKNMLDKWVIDGGWTMIPLVILLAVTIFLIIYCCMSLKREKFCPEALKAQLIALMGECRVRSAIEMATSSPTYLGRLVAYALPNIDANRPDDLGKDGIEDAIADFTANERPQIMITVDMLALSGSLAPSIGLFGTVQGMVGAFAILAETGQADPTQLAGSISVALLTTFWGLIISIIAIPAFFFLKKKAQSLEAQCINTVEEMVNTSINVLNADAQLARIPEGLSGDEGEEGEAYEGEYAAEGQA
ncbi:MAG TPA: MotA/TolQ/ExbB proton channel family protein [Candidatus Akkermansia intestinigallinarum]|uniref:MotA/TolQ/ExbB proton channel family protein n=1 Tax=Candidatus Akkermansia intestinigallinarum TaxID=2838431 RepID=A0A9D2AGP3_9BACT|nr:MotA/TolQ/ExbB proton channel family protein [Candidatus Akkermansia intestinigallinarum]